MGYLIVDRKSGNYIAASEEHSFTNHIAHAAVIEDEDEARAVMKGANKVQKGAELSLLQEVE